VSGWSFIGAPADSVSRGGGAELAPARLRQLDLPARLDAVDRGDLAVRVRGNDRDPETGIIGSDEVIAESRIVREAVGALVAAGDRVFLAGGCCAAAPGAVAGAAAGTRIALVYVDGHQDMWDGRTSPTGEAADMPFGVAIGVGPSAWIRALGGRTVEPADAWLLGNRDDADALAAGLEEPSALGVRHRPLDAVRSAGPGVTADDACLALERGPGRFWLHLDVDVLDPRVFPATDYLDPGGLAWDELAELLAPFGRATGLLGVSLGCYNPEKDPDASVGARLVAMLVGALAS
jgi:arginase